MLSYASAYKMCVPTLSKLLNATARSRRAGPRACRLPDQLAWETLPGSAREGVSSYQHIQQDNKLVIGVRYVTYIRFRTMEKAWGDVSGLTPLATPGIIWGCRSLARGARGGTVSEVAA